jgi:NADH-quinone oxidoreductase subunit L
MTIALWFLPVLPLVVGAVLAPSGRWMDRAACWIGVGVGALALALALVTAAGRPSVSAPFLAGLPVGLAVDGLSALMILTVTGVLLAVLLYTAGERGDARLVGLLLLFAGAMLVTVTATTLLTLLLGWEVMGATSYALIAYWWREPERVSSGTTAFLATRAGDVGLYLAAGAAFAGLGSLDLARLSALNGWELQLATAGIVVAAAGKSAQLPFSFWLSRAMSGPSQVSAFLHSATMVAAGAYLLLRLAPLLAESGWGGRTVAWLGAVTALALGIVAVAQRDLKQLLAASTCAQVGLMVLAAGSAGVAGGAEHLVAHAATKSLLFLGAGAWLAALGTEDLAGLRGAGRRWPPLSAAVAIGGAALAGLPPLSLWVTKDAVLAAALQDSPALYAVGLAAAGLSALYAGKMLLAVLAPSAPAAEALHDADGTGTRQVPGLMTVPVVALAVPAAGLAAFGLPAVADAVARTLGTEPVQVRWWEAALSAAVAVAGVALAARLRPLVTKARRPAGLIGWTAGWLGLEPAAHRLVVRPALALSRALARFDDRVIDGAVRGISAGVLGSAQLADRRGESAVSGVVGAVAACARDLGRLARRPQTGLVHQYYAQAVAVLAVLAVVVLLVR